MTGLPFETSDSDLAAREQFFSAHKVLFLYPEVATAPSFSLSSKHLGAGYIRAFLKRHHIPTGQFTTEDRLSLDEAVDRVLREDPAILGVSVYDCTYHTVKMLVREMKARKPELQVILGGPTATFSDQVILEDFPEADLCVRGEGEYTLYEVLDAFYRGQNYGQIAGLTFRPGGASKIRRNADRELIHGDDKEGAMDILPSPYLEGIITPSEGGQIGIITSRGCAFKCVYCNFSAMSRWTVRFHSVERVVSELNYITQHQKKGQKLSLAIQDDAFSLHKERAKEICRRIIDQGLQLQIDCETRADAVDRELLELMRRAGFRDLHFGVESGSPRVLREIKKARSSLEAGDGFEPEKKFLQKIREGVHTAVELGLKPTVSIILGLPAETRKEGLESMEFIASLDPCAYYHNFLEIFAGTELFETHERYGIGLKKVYGEAVNRLYKTIYPYDVSRVPVLQDRSLFNSSLRSAEMAAQLCGDPYLFPKETQQPYPSLVVFTNTIFPDLSSINWFLQNAGSHTRLAFLWQMDGSRPGSTGFYEIHMPVQMLYWLKQRHPEEKQAQMLEETFTHNPENCIPHPFAFMDIRDYERPWGVRPPAPERQSILLIEQESSGRGYYREVEKLLALQEMLYRSQAANLNFLDICRWSPAPCPASTLERVVVDGNRDLFPCLSGRPVGRIGESVKAVKKRIEILAGRIQEARGCARCPAQGSCSKCLFPYPMGAAEFCGIRLRTHYNGSHRRF